MTSRGLRNCNPGNIRLGKTKWQGEVAGKDKSFCTFKNMAWGYRALLRTLQNYRKIHHCRTLKEMIYRWAPENENNSSAYLMNVSRKMEVPTMYVPNVDDKDTMVAMACAISEQENGVKAIRKDVEAGWDLL